MITRPRVFTLALLTTLCAGMVMGQGQGQPLTTTKVYRVKQANVETLTKELKAAFADDPAIRIAGEVNTGRIVVIAPDDVHKQLGPLMRDTGGVPVTEVPSRQSPPQSLPKQPQRPNPMVANDGPGNRVVSLQNLSSMDLRNSVSRLYRGRAPSQKSQDGRTETMTVGSDNKNAVRLRFDFSTNNIMIQGGESSVEAWQRLIRVLDNPSVVRDERTTLVSVSGQRPRSIHRAMDLIELRTNGNVRKPTTRADIVQWNLDNKQPVNPRRPATQLAQAPGGQQPPPGTLPAQPPADGGEQEGLLGPVQIEYLDGLDVIVLRGNKKDVDRVNAIIKEIEDLSVVTEPTIEIVDLQHVDSEAIADIVTPLQDEVLSVRQGRVSITPLVKPNSILLLGREESVKVVKDLILKLDRPVEPNKQFHVFRLANANAAEAEELITNFFEERGGLGTRLRIVSDFRSNSLIVQASPRDASEIRDLLSKMDVAKGSAISEVRVFKLKNSYAEDLAPILEGALRGGGGASATGDGGFPGGDAGGTSASRATALSLTTVDAQGQRQYQSGVLADVEVTADTRTNAIVVRGPAESMDLIGALIRQLDALPDEDAEIKVFTIVNGDALLLADVLNNLFGTTTTGGGAGGFGGGGTNTNDNSIAMNPLIPLRFSVDERTNSIVATGSLADLRVVEAILLRLDEEGIRQRRSTVVRLRFAPALDVSSAINDLLTSERAISDFAPNTLTPIQQLEQEVVVVPEPVSNSLIVSATPRYYQQILSIIQELDRRPPMVMIQVLIAEINLSRFYELGVEVGIQDPLLFDRSLLADGVIQPGFNFNNQPLGNADNATSLLTAGTIGAQGLGTFGLGRINSDLGFGGLVLSASSDALSVLLRALEQDQRAQVLSRPQVMTLDNQEAFVQVGQRVPIVQASNITITGTQNQTTFENVGLLLRVVPRISPDGLVVMEVNAENSSLGATDDGIPISISANGDVIRSPIINTTLAQTTVSARSGQTVVIGGLITENDRQTNRSVPFLSGIPLLGDLFRYDQDSDDRTELMVIMTPYIVRNDQDINCINQMETERMSWCLSDVYRVHGCFNVTGCQGFSDGTFPNQDCLGGAGSCRPDSGLGMSMGTLDQMGEFGTQGSNIQTIFPDQTPTVEELQFPQNYTAPDNLPGTGGFESVPNSAVPPPPNGYGYGTGASSNANRDAAVRPASAQLMVPRVPRTTPAGTPPYRPTLQPVQAATRQ